MQLLFEFTKLCDGDVVTNMAKNWQDVCATLLPNKDHLCFADEWRSLQIIEKNIYHKKPSTLLITFNIVSPLRHILFLWDEHWQIQRGFH